METFVIFCSKSVSRRHLHVGRGSSDPYRWHTRPLGHVDKALTRKWRPPFFSPSGPKKSADITETPDEGNGHLS